MNVKSIRSMPGPNIYHTRPVMVMELDLGDFDQKESKEFRHFNESLVKLLPGLADHHCASGRPGGFIQRLMDGTYLSHVVEHVALELMSLTGFKVYYGKTKYNEEIKCYNVVVAYEDEDASEYLLKASVELVEASIAGRSFPVTAAIQLAHELAKRNKLGISTQALVEAAKKRNIPLYRIGKESYFRLGQGIYSKYIEASITSDTSAVGVDISCDKALTKHILYQHAIPVPEGKTVETLSEALDFWRSFNAPVVIKPLDSSHGNGVTVNVNSPQDVVRAFHKAQKYGKRIIVEEYLHGKNYRVLIIHGKCVAASERLPAGVVGNGIDTIECLIQRVNEDPWRGNGHDNILSKIVIDRHMEDFLRKKGLSLKSIPDKGQRVDVIDSINISTGGTAIDVTEQLHPQVRIACERSARAVGLNVCGVDLMAEDISRPLQQGEGIIEVNAAPGLRMHEYPSGGKQRHVAEAIIDMLYPQGAPSRIPIISITGTNGKTTVTRMVDFILSQSTRKVTGMTTTDGIFINGVKIKDGDMSGRYSAEVVLADPTVEIAVLETARGGIMRRGLGYDWSDIGVITNIQNDHIGQDGIKSIEDLIWVKSLVAERVREGGTLIINADDANCVDLPKHPRLSKVHRKVVYFSRFEDNPTITLQRHRGGHVFYIKDNWIVEENYFQKDYLINLNDIPATLHGHAVFNVYNAMIAIAVCRAYGLSRHQIAPHISQFEINQHNPGRANVFQHNGSQILLDYGHNPDAFLHVALMANHLKQKRLLGVIGVPGDREDSVIQESGRVLAENFDALIIKEDYDLRGRAPGEAAEILKKAIFAINPRVNVRIVLNEDEAVKVASEIIEPGDFCVIFYEKLENITQSLRTHFNLKVTPEQQLSYTESIR